MVEPVITTGVALIGVGAWFADKVFGPSAEALGGQIKAYVSTRIRKITQRAQILAESRGEEELIQPLPPGFVYGLVQKASYSEDDDVITDLWANLLLESSKLFSSKHSVFSSILGEIGRPEVDLLNRLWPEGKKSLDTSGLAHGPRTAISEEIEEILDKSEKIKNHDAFSRFADQLLGYSYFWPFIVHEIEVTSGGKRARSRWNRRTFPAVDSYAAESLARQRIMEYIEIIDEPLVFQDQRTVIRGFTLTRLGAEFLCVCRGYGDPWDLPDDEVGD